MQWLRRNENRANLTNQNIKFQFNNEILNSLSKTLIPVFFSNDGTSKLNSENSNWSVWSEGTVSIGKTGDTFLFFCKRCHYNCNYFWSR